MFNELLHNRDATLLVEQLGENDDDVDVEPDIDHYGDLRSAFAGGKQEKHLAITLRSILQLGFTDQVHFLVGFGVIRVPLTCVLCGHGDSAPTVACRSNSGVVSRIPLFRCSRMKCHKFMNGWTDSIFQLSSKLMSKGDTCRLEVNAAVCLVWGYLHRLTDTELHLMTGVSYRLVATYTRGLRTLLMAQQVADQDCLTRQGLSGDVEVDETAIRRTRVADDTQISGYQVLHRRYIGMIIRGTHDVCVFQLPEKLVQTGAPPAPIRKEEWIPVSKFVKPRPGPVDHDNVTIVHSDGAKAYLVHTPDGAYSMNVVHSKKQYVAHKPLMKNGVKIKGSDGHTIRRQTGTQAADAFWRTMKRGILSRQRFRRFGQLRPS